jgi:hypothetical protein
MAYPSAGMEYTTIYVSYLGLMVMVFSGCNSENSSNSEQPKKPHSKIFELISNADHHISFRNDIKENLGTNYMIYDGIYQGAGLAIGDLNNDGLDDIFFCGNQATNQLYINKGGLEFENITNSAGILQDDGWSMGVTMVDVDGNGFKDIYVCQFIWDQPERRKNLLYLNQGDLTFIESGEAWGVSDPGYSVQSAFLDFDKDGDLDLYVVNQPPNNKAIKEKLKGLIDYQYTDRLYRNDGNKFVDITRTAGVKNYAYGLSATVADLNWDGWPDIYVACDYEEPDLMYMNNGDGTFTNASNESLRHMSNFSMGADIADINNDGWLDIYTADMVAEDNKRLKTNMSGMNPEKFWGLAEAGYHYQYMFNALQINNGNGNFSELGQLSQVHATDWSWSPLLADFDNDGFKDIIVTNGQKRDVRNNDFHINRRKHIEETIAESQKKGINNPAFNPIDLLEMAPSVKLKNYAYRNNGDLTFSKVMDDWGLNQLSWSHGSAMSDLDNDGDLDLVMNNHDDPIFLYKNLSSENNAGNHIRFKLRATDAEVFGAKVVVKTNGTEQLAHLHPIRGYMSQSEQALHFGLGKNNTVDEVIITWPNGKSQTIKKPEINKTHIVLIGEATESLIPDMYSPLFSNITKPETLTHKENIFNDYEREILLPHKMSTLGPTLALADINGDKIDDFYLCGALNEPGSLMLSSGNGHVKTSSSAFNADKIKEDIGAVFFDADGDNDFDLYVTSGGNELSQSDENYSDRLYINLGNANFKKSSDLPKDALSNSCAVPFDYDNDGDLDLFVGGRQTPGKWPFPTDSRILRNDEGKFTDVTAKVAPDLEGIGMVTDAHALDVNGDGNKDLVLIGEWMAITFLIQNDGKLKKTNLGTDHAVGWWNTIVPADIDGDGDIDILAGNLGLNIKYKASTEAPFSVYCHDFDESGTLDIVLSYYQQGSCFPVRGRECSSQQMPFIKDKFPTYGQFGVATIKDIHGEKLDKSLQYHATEFRSGTWINDGTGSFSFSPFPNEAQVSTIQGIVPYDVNSDGNLDLIMAGNYYNREVETTRSDAGIGVVLLSDGSGNYTAMHPTKHGLNLYQDVRDLKLLKGANGSIQLIAAINNEQIQIYELNQNLR